MRRVLWTGIVTVLAASCSPSISPRAADGTWVGTITTEGNITTVVNESGSVWGGAATLVEEASIGVESGDEHYMFDRITGVHLTDDRIYVADDTPSVRVFDYDGAYLRDIGARGQGPGEFEWVAWVSTGPDGRVFVAGGPRRINVYGPDPGMIDTWPMGNGACCLHPMVVTPEGAVWLEGGVVNEEARRLDPAFQEYGPDGPVGDPFLVPQYDYERWTLRRNGRDIEVIPNAPEVVFQMIPTGQLVAGSSDEYRFEIISTDGSKTVVEKYWEPIEVSATELDYHRRSIPARYGSNEAGSAADLGWDGRLPRYKPAFWAFVGTQEGTIWVIRPGPATDIEACDSGEMAASSSGRGPKLPRRCFDSSWIVDVFDAEGRYLGEVDTTVRGGTALLIPAYTDVRGDTLVSEAEDEDGTIMVKRYRLVLPGETQD